MKYMGSKRKIAAEILPIILYGRKQGQYYVEPFAGGLNTLIQVKDLRIGADINDCLIEFYKAVCKGWLPPIRIEKEEYYAIKDNPGLNKPLTGWAGIFCSYGAKWFGGFISDYQENKRLKSGRLPNHQDESYNSLLKQRALFKDVDFRVSSYENLEIPPNSIIYCDPPYRGTTGYKDKFDHDAFWQWCRDKSAEGHAVYISEYSAPEDFICVWQKELSSQLSANTKPGGSKLSIEKLYTYL